MLKTCFKCQRRQPLSAFYRHPRMTDGHLGKCKTCAKADTRAHRLAHAEYYRAYDRARRHLPHRRRLAALYQARERHQYPLRTRVRLRARRAYRKAPETCQMCGHPPRTRLERHHPDYDLPLLIVWLCKSCHVIADRARRAGDLVTGAAPPAGGEPSSATPRRGAASTVRSPAGR